MQEPGAVLIWKTKDPEIKNENDYASIKQT